MIGLVKSIDSNKPANAGTTDRKRKMVADLCRLMGRQLSADSAAPVQAPSLAAALLANEACAHLPPRVRETLEHMLTGDSEKQVALRMGVSRHTVHVYVKALYRHFQVSSRGELLAKFVSPDALSRR